MMCKSDVLKLLPKARWTIRSSAAHMHAESAAPLLPSDETSPAPELFPQPSWASRTSTYEDGKWTASVTYPIGRATIITPTPHTTPYPTPTARTNPHTHP